MIMTIYYKHISSLLSISKIIEKVAYNQISHYFTSHNVRECVNLIASCLI